MTIQKLVAGASAADPLASTGSQVATAVNGLIGANYYPQITEAMTPQQIRQVINADINTAYTMGGGVVNIPKGTFLVNGAIRMLPNTELKGAGRHLTTIRMDKDISPTANSSEGWGNNANIVSVSPVEILPSQPSYNNMAIRGICLDFNSAEILASGAHAAAWQSRIDGAALDNVGNCIVGKGDYENLIFADGLAVENCDCRNAIFHGTAFYALTRNVKIKDNYYYRNGYRAAHIHGETITQTVENLTITGNTAVENCFLARNLIANPASLNGGLYVAFKSARNAVIANNIVRDDYGVGIHIWGDVSGGALTTDSVSIADNIVSGCATGILAGNGCRAVSITGNSIKSSRNQSSGAANGALGRGIEISGNNASSALTVAGNTVFDCDGQAFRALNIDGCTFSGNTFTENNKAAGENQAVLLQNIRHCTFSGNTVFNNGRVAFDFCAPLSIEATVAPNSTETAGTDGVLISGNYLSGGQRGNASAIIVSGGTAAAPHCRGVAIQGNRVRRPRNNAGNYIDLTAQVSRVMYNDILTGTVLDKMTPGTTNLVVGNY
jgi:hypothetical protein